MSGFIQNFIKHNISKKYYSDRGGYIGRYVFTKESFPTAQGIGNFTTIQSVTDTDDVIRFTPKGLTYIKHAILACVNLANKQKTNVIMNFRGVEINIAYPAKSDDSAIQDIVELYYINFYRLVTAPAQNIRS